MTRSHPPRACERGRARALANTSRAHDLQASAARALASGTTTDGVLAMLKEVTPQLSCPVVLFSYFGLIAQWGLADFATAAKEAGVEGLIVPDLPYASTDALRSEAMKNNLELVGPFAIRLTLHSYSPFSCHREAETETKEALILLTNLNNCCMHAGAAHDTSYTGRKDERNHKRFRRFYLPCECMPI